MTIELGIASYLFGKAADFSIGTFLDKLGFKEKKDRKKLEKAVEEFKNYIDDRHKDNPDFEAIIDFWEKNRVIEEIVKIRYSLDSQYRGYNSFKKYLESKEVVNKFNKSLSTELMDELEKKLSQTVQNMSNFKQADVAVFNNMIEKSTVSSQNQNSEIVSIEEIQVEVTDKDSIVYTIRDMGFNKYNRLVYTVEISDDRWENISQLLLTGGSSSVNFIDNCTTLKECYLYFKTLRSNTPQNDEKFNEYEQAEMLYFKRINASNEMIESIKNGLNIYFEYISKSNEIIQTPSDLKYLIETMLNGTAVNSGDKKYQFFVNRNDGIYFNVYLSQEDILHINKKNDSVLRYAALGGDFMIIDSFSRDLKVKILAELLSMLVKYDKKDLPNKYYQINNYMIALG